MSILENFSLKKLNTFGIDVSTRWFASFQTIEDLHHLSKIPIFQGINKFILGGGSNILFTSNYDGLLIKTAIKGIEIVDENDAHIYVKVGGGEEWHHFVLHCVRNNWAGVENLSLIPGTVGAAPIQNIGAYGAEVKDVFYELEAYHLETGKIQVFSKEQCKFGYRDSIFKQELKGKVVILSVTFKLNKKAMINTSYGDINKELEAQCIFHPTIKDVSQAVCTIRSKKLPDPKEIGNAGSFFKNPIIEETQLNRLKEAYPSIVSYTAGPHLVKVAAGWLIEQCGWKGKRVGDAGVHKNQALVLVNYGNAKGHDIIKLAKEIQDSVMEKFTIKLDPEINIL